jgi:hypothetical protein
VVASQQANMEIPVTAPSRNVGTKEQQGLHLGHTGLIVSRLAFSSMTRPL